FPAPAPPAAPLSGGRPAWIGRERAAPGAAARGLRSRRVSPPPDPLRPASPRLRRANTAHPWSGDPMSVVTFVNPRPRGPRRPLEVRLHQGEHQVLRLAVAAGGYARVPVSPAYAVQAFTSHGDVALSSNVIHFSGASISLRARMRSASGLAVFELGEGPGREI